VIFYEYVSVMIGYLKRVLKMKVPGRKNTIAVTKAINATWGEDMIPEEIITDNEKVLCSEIFEEIRRGGRIKHRRIGVEFREGLEKDESGTLEERVGRIEKRYNNTCHIAIKRTPNEAWGGNNEIVSTENGPEGSYKNRFKKRHRKRFEEG
jgi:hypothetical protein